MYLTYVIYLQDLISYTSEVQHYNSIYYKVTNNHNDLILFKYTS